MKWYKSVCRWMRYEFFSIAHILMIIVFIFLICRLFIERSENKDNSALISIIVALYSVMVALIVGFIANRQLEISKREAIKGEISNCSEIIDLLNEAASIHFSGGFIEGKCDIIYNKMANIGIDEIGDAKRDVWFLKFKKRIEDRNRIMWKMNKVVTIDEKSASIRVVESMLLEQRQRILGESTFEALIGEFVDADSKVSDGIDDLRNCITTYRMDHRRAIEGNRIVG